MISRRLVAFYIRFQPIHGPILPWKEHLDVAVDRHVVVAPGGYVAREGRVFVVVAVVVLEKYCYACFVEEENYCTEFVVGFVEAHNDFGRQVRP